MDFSVVKNTDLSIHIVSKHLKQFQYSLVPAGLSFSLLLLMFTRKENVIVVMLESFYIYLFLNDVLY